MMKIDGRKSFRLGCTYDVLMIKTEIFEAYGRFIISCYNCQIKGRDRILYIPNEMFFFQDNAM